MDCSSETRLLQFREGLLTPEAAGSFERHLAGCVAGEGESAAEIRQRLEPELESR